MAAIRDVYNLLNKKIDCGIQGYQIVKKYEDPDAIIKSRQAKRKLAELKRGSYLEDQHKIHKQVPGVGKYQLSPQRKQTTQLKKKSHSQKKTYVDEILDRGKRQKSPAPGQYDVLKSMGQQSIKKSSSQHNLKNQYKISYLDHAEYEGTLTPGVGQYDINRWQRSKTEASASKLPASPRYWRQHHKQQAQRHKSNSPKQPDMRTYRPKTLAYELFEQKTKISRQLSENKNKMRYHDRFKTEGKGQEHLGPGKYLPNNVWAPQQKNKKSVLDSISKGSPKSVYYH